MELSPGCPKNRVCECLLDWSLDIVRVQLTLASFLVLLLLLPFSPDAATSMHLIVFSLCFDTSSNYVYVHTVFVCI